MPKRSRHKKPNRHERNTVSGHGRGNSEPQADSRTGKGMSATTSTSQSGPTRVIDSRKDQELLTMLGQQEGWQFSDASKVTIPHDLEQMAYGKDAEGEYLFESKDRKWAIDRIRMMTRDNWQRDAKNIHFHQRNEFMLSRHSRAETPEADTTETPENTGNTVDAVAFVEKVSDAEMLDAATQLQQLGLLELLIGKEP